MWLYFAIFYERDDILTNEINELELKGIIEKLQVDVDKRNEEIVMQEREINSLREMLKKESFSDILTGFYNHKAFESILLHKKHRAERTKKPFSILLVDINNFKSINEEYGHSIGDEVLRNFSSNIKDMLRSEDSISRWKDDEFVILLSETNIDEASIVSSKLKFYINKWKIKVKDKFLFYTYSIGISQYKFDESVESVLERSRESLERDRNNY